VGAAFNTEKEGGKSWGHARSYSCCLPATTLLLITAVTHVSVQQAKYKYPKYFHHSVHPKPPDWRNLGCGTLCVCISLDIAFLYVLSMSYSNYLNKI
jgi:hypothetical protein